MPEYLGEQGFPEGEAATIGRSESLSRAAYLPREWDYWDLNKVNAY
jgi:hypothetical protein